MAKWNLGFWTFLKKQTIANSEINLTEMLCDSLHDRNKVPQICKNAVVKLLRKLGDCEQLRNLFCEIPLPLNRFFQTYNSSTELNVL